MRIVTIGPQHEVLRRAYLDRKAEKATVPQGASNSLKYRRQVAEVEKHIGGDRKIEIVGLRLQELGQFAADQIVVDSALPCNLEHARGEINPGQRSGERVKSRSEQTCAATQVKNVQLARRAKTHDCIKQQIRSPISQFADQVLIKAVGIFIKKLGDEPPWSGDRGCLGTKRGQCVSNDLGIAPLCAGLTVGNDGFLRSMQRLPCRGAG